MEWIIPRQNFERECKGCPELVDFQQQTHGVTVNCGLVENPDPGRVQAVRDRIQDCTSLTFLDNPAADTDRPKTP